MIGSAEDKSEISSDVDDLAKCVGFAKKVE